MVVYWCTACADLMWSSLSASCRLPDVSVRTEVRLPASILTTWACQVPEVSRLSMRSIFVLGSWMNLEFPGREKSHVSKFHMAPKPTSKGQ